MMGVLTVQRRYNKTISMISMAGGVPWTPALISTLAWFDASDLSTFSFGTGSQVSQWNDKSGNGNHIIQATGTRQPVRDTVTNPINSLAVVTFDGTDDRLSKSTSLIGFPQNTTGYTAVLVFRIRGATGPQRTLLDISDAAATNRTWHFLTDTTTPLLRSRIFDTGATDATLSASYTNPVLVSGLGVTSKRQCWFNGTAGTANLTVESTGVAAAFQIGINLSGTTPFLGDMGEIVIFSGENDTTRQLVEGYEAWKWNTVADLDAGHPYKSAAPTV